MKMSSVLMLFSFASMVLSLALWNQSIATNAVVYYVGAIILGKLEEKK